MYKGVLGALLFPEMVSLLLWGKSNKFRVCVHVCKGVAVIAKNKPVISDSRHTCCCHTHALTFDLWYAGQGKIQDFLHSFLSDIKAGLIKMDICGCNIPEVACETERERETAC